MAFDGSANTNTALQSSVAFLQIQKNANLKRSTSMNEDVFRIFRQTGRRIALIKQQVERERCTYLKDSYTEKNQLYKELAGIFHSKKTLMEKNRQIRGDANSAVSLPALRSRVSLTEGTNCNNDCDKQFSAHKTLKELRSINVNVLKRCECCRRRAFRTVDSEDDVDDGFDEDAFQCENNGQAPDDKTQDKARRRKSQVNKEKKTLVQFSRCDDVRIPTTQRVQAGMWALKKQTNGRSQPMKKKTVSFQVNGSTTKLHPAEEKAASTTPSLTASTRPTLKSRASIKLECQANKNNARLHLEGNDWTSHVETVQERKINSSNTISGLSKAYCAFRNLLRKLEEENQGEEVADEEDDRCESRTDLSASRPASNMSRTDSRWLPLRRCSDTLSLRLNSWTTGGSEPACMESFNEKGEGADQDSLTPGHSFDLD